MNMAGAGPRLIYLLWKSSTATRILIDHKGRSEGVTLGQYTILALLRGRDKVSSADLARQLEVSPQSINGTVKSLEAKQYLVGQLRDDNRKTRWLSLTEQGTAYLDQAERVIDDAEAEMFKALSAADEKKLRSLLSGIIGAARDTQR